MNILDYLIAVVLVGIVLFIGFACGFEEGKESAMLNKININYERDIPSCQCRCCCKDLSKDHDSARKDGVLEGN